MDHYNTLGVPRDADQDTIKKAYRKLAMQHHPDKGGDSNQFQKISTAYETLSNVDKRFQYDNPQAQTQGFPSNFNFNAQGFDINDLFSQIFGQQRSYTQQKQKQVFRTQVYVSLIDSYNGSNQMMHLNIGTGPKVVNFTVPKGIDSGEQVRYDDLIVVEMIYMQAYPFQC